MYERAPRGLRRLALAVKVTLDAFKTRPVLPYRNSAFQGGIFRALLTAVGIIVYGN
jgi:hypothetical protein